MQPVFAVFLGEFGLVRPRTYFSLMTEIVWGASDDLFLPGCMAVKPASKLAMMGSWPRMVGSAGWSRRPPSPVESSFSQRVLTAPVGEMTRMAFFCESVT